MTAETQAAEPTPRDPRFEDWTERLSSMLYIRFTRGPDYEDAFLCIDDGEPDMNDVARMSFGQARKLQAALNTQS